MDRATLAINVKPMVRDGLHAVSPAVEDRRVRMVRATPAGAQRLEHAVPRGQEAQSAFEAHFGAQRTVHHRAELNAAVEASPRPWGRRHVRAGQDRDSRRTAVVTPSS